LSFHRVRTLTDGRLTFFSSVRALPTMLSSRTIPPSNSWDMHIPRNNASSSPLATHCAFRFRGTDVVGTKPPAGLLGRDADLMLVEQVDRQGLLVRVTSPERTLVDVLDRPRLAGTWEEIWRSLESIPAVDVEHVVAYASLLSSATTVARVGFFLEQHRSRIRVTGHQLQILHALQPASVSYLDKGARGTLVRQWNLVVPEEVLHRSWEEPA
jgi:hypothetical protein